MALASRLEEAVEHVVAAMHGDVLRHLGSARQHQLLLLLDDLRRRRLVTRASGEVFIAEHLRAELRGGVRLHPGQDVLMPERSTLTLATERSDVILRELSMADLDSYFELVNRDRNHLNQRGDYAFEAIATRDDIANYFTSPSDDNIRFGVWCGQELAGRVDLVPIDPPRYVIGYWLDDAATGQGLATVACRTAIDYGRTLGATEVYAGITNGNTPSIGVVMRLGFEHIQDVENRSRWRLALTDAPPAPVMA